jgi:hypothetical protein
VSFSKCTSETCLHCSSKPIKATSAVGHLRTYGGMLSPIPSPWHEGHYATFMEVETLADLGKQTTDDFCPSKINSCLGQCEQQCSYIFMSKADKTRQIMMCHSSRKHTMGDDQDQEQTPAIICPFVTDAGECGQVFPTRYQLSKHRDQSGHKVKRGRWTQYNGLAV